MNVLVTVTEYVYGKLQSVTEGLINNTLSLYTFTVMQSVIGIIPARYASQRFPGKPLAKILGKTLIQHTYENAKRCDLLEKIVVATDDQRIYDHVKEFGGEVLMTSVDCPTGSDRLVEALRQDPELDKADIVLNIQGDEPLLDPSTLCKIAEVLMNDPKAVVSTPIIRLRSEEEALNPSVVKCVIDKKGHALYFSRGLIPAGKNLKFDPEKVYWRHVGLYGYRTPFLKKYASLKQTPLQLAEDLEQLRILEHGYVIKTCEIKIESLDVNTPEDLKKVELLLCKQNTSL